MGWLSKSSDMIKSFLFLRCIVYCENDTLYSNKIFKFMRLAISDQAVLCKDDLLIRFYMMNISDHRSNFRMHLYQANFVIKFKMMNSREPLLPNFLIMWWHLIENRLYTNWVIGVSDFKWVALAQCEAYIDCAQLKLNSIIRIVHFIEPVE